MYKATKKERKILIKEKGYTSNMIDSLEVGSSDIRHGLPINAYHVPFIVSYQSDLKMVRDSLKKWWHFWKK